MTVCDINLIATRRAHKQRALAIMRCVTYSLVAVLIGVALLYAKLWMATRLVQGDIAIVEARLSDPALAESVERIQFLEANIAELNPRVVLLEKVHDSEDAWLDILRDTSAAIPKGVWISQMQSRRTDKDQTITLKGSAYTQRDVGEFMLRVDELRWSRMPDLGYTQAEDDPRGRTLVGFEVTVPLENMIGSDLK
jgi:Tfp pilus assembly protein PilN